MRYSRLRLRLAGWFALAMLLGLTLLDAGLYALLRERGDARLSDQVTSAARGLRDAVLREAAEVPPPTLGTAVHDALDEWPAGPDALMVLAEDGSPVGNRGAPRLLAAAQALTALPRVGQTLDVPLDEEGAARVAADRSSEATAAFTVIAIRSTAPVQEDLKTLAAWLLLSIPLVLLVSLPAGYFLARRALAPFGSLATELERMTPQALDRRLPVGTPPDELDRVADQVNRLLDRLAGAQAHTRRFLAQAAHQLRTPLTLIRGESDLAIERQRSAEDYRASLGRVSRAAGQMSHRVDDLLLLARAEAGERVTRTERVELDAVALEAADLMRGRAQALGHHLVLGEMEGVEVVGDEGLLREAAVEMLENACRHGTTDAPVRIAVRGTDGVARLEVVSAGPPAQQASQAAGEGLGLTIVRWIATAHGGTLEQTHDGRTNRFSLALPAATGQGGD